MANRKSRKAPEDYRRRDYRAIAEHSGLVSSYVRIRETDLHILAPEEVTGPAGDLAAGCRIQLERYLDRYPGLISALGPVPLDPLAPPLVRAMLTAGISAAVGPMAAVAGAIAEAVARGLVDGGFKEVIVENGGDLFLHRSSLTTVAVFAGQSPLSGRIGISLEPARLPVAVCTSSGTVGHSLSLGNADSATVVAASGALADACATRLGNEVGCGRNPREGIDRALETAHRLPDIRGALIICGELMGAVGDIEITPVGGGSSWQNG